MTDAKMREICDVAVEELGYLNQMYKTIEELAELQRALARHIAGEGRKTELHVCEEIADVEIMLNQMRLIFDPKEIDDWKDSKLERLARMVGVEIEEEAT